MFGSISLFKPELISLQVLMHGGNKALADCGKTEQVEAILPLCEFSKVFFLVHITSDEDEVYCRKELLKKLLPASAAGAIPSHVRAVFSDCIAKSLYLTQRLLFYSTEIGKSAIIRQISPHLHIDCKLNLILCAHANEVIWTCAVDEATCAAMSKFVRVMVQVLGTDRVPTQGISWQVLSSLSQLGDLRVSA